MAVYKVPQDVEAEDKLIGPFSFRQFIYLIIVAIAIAVGWFLGQIFIGLAILPLPIILFFGALALPLRKDQPMEVYLAAMVKFFLKPKKRMWDPEGQFSRITISAPTTEDFSRTKEYSRDEAGQRLEYLAQVIDTQGWASRGVPAPSDSSFDPSLAAEEAQTTETVFSEDDQVNKKFTSLIEEQEEIRRQQTLSEFQKSAQSPPPVKPKAAKDYVTFPGQPKPDSYASLNAEDKDSETETSPVFNPYPQMRQKVINPNPNPVSTTKQTPKPQSAPQSEDNSQLPAPVTDEQASNIPPSPDIIRLAGNNDLSIDAIAREAHRIEEKQNQDQEVVISLR